MIQNQKQKKSESKPEPIQISPGFIVRFSSITVAILSILSLCGQYLKYFTEYDQAFGLIPLVNMDGELSIPAILSVLLLFSAACLLFIITTLKRKNKEPHVFAWAILSIGFLLMAFDEGATIHEKLMPIVLRLIGDNLPSIFYFPWVIPAIAGLLLLAPFFIKFYIDLPKRTKRDFLLSGVIYVGGAIGFELVSGYYAGMHGMKNFGFNVIATIEEILEMTGMIIFINSLLTYIEEHYGKLQFRIENKFNPGK